MSEAAAVAPAPALTTTPRGHAADRAFAWSARGAGLLVMALVTLIGLFLLWQAVPSLQANEASFLTSREWDLNATTPRFGVADLLWTTVTASVWAMMLAVPLGVCVALFITQYAPDWLRTPAAALVDLLAAVPSIVYGLWGLIVLRPVVAPVETWIAHTFGWFPLFAPTPITGGTIFFIGVVLAIMILPIVTAISREVFAAPTPHKEGALALGATKWEMIRTAVSPSASPASSAPPCSPRPRARRDDRRHLHRVDLGTGSAFTASLFNGGETFASGSPTTPPSSTHRSKTGAFIAAGLVLFILTFVVNAIARVVIDRRKAFTE
jgi:phosphate transport system permease protein